jgi:hypothetical protein
MVKDWPNDNIRPMRQLMKAGRESPESVDRLPHPPITPHELAGSAVETEMDRKQTRLARLKGRTA